MEDIGELFRLRVPLPLLADWFLVSLDCAFNDNTATRKKDESSTDDALKGLVKALASTKDKEKLTLSGLLNALDGVNSVEGKIIVATTSKSSSSASHFCQARADLFVVFLSPDYIGPPLFLPLISPGQIFTQFFSFSFAERLDPALIRPGRIDQRLYFGLTTQDQLRGLFEQTHLPTKGELEREEKETASASADDEKLPARKSKEEVVELAIKFSEAVPSNTFSAASIQGFLFSYQGK